MVINNHGTNAMKIHRWDVAKWVAHCWALVTEKTIQNSWKKCGYDINKGKGQTSDRRLLSDVANVGFFLEVLVSHICC
jgi:hypothetical protein